MRRTIAVLLALTATAAGAATPGPAVGAWATYRWTSTAREEVPVIVRQAGPGGQVSWSVAQEVVPPAVVECS